MPPRRGKKRSIEETEETPRNRQTKKRTEDDMILEVEDQEEEEEEQELVDLTREEGSKRVVKESRVKSLSQKEAKSLFQEEIKRRTDEKVMKLQSQKGKGKGKGKEMIKPKSKPKSTLATTSTSAFSTSSSTSKTTTTTTSATTTSTTNVKAKGKGSKDKGGTVVAMKKINKGTARTKVNVLLSPPKASTRTRKRKAECLDVDNEVDDNNAEEALIRTEERETITREAKRKKINNSITKETAKMLFKSDLEKRIDAQLKQRATKKQNKTEKEGGSKSNKKK